MSVRNVLSFNQQIGELKSQRNGAFNFLYGRRLNVVILGAGTAGLLRAIQSVMDGHLTQVVEKRLDGEGLLNTVAINIGSYPILEEYGIYQWLLENKKIEPFDEKEDSFFSVRLKDLVNAMKAVLKELVPNEPIIRYESTVQAIEQGAPKSTITLQTKEGLVQIHDVDIINNAEGSRSTTNELLGIHREEYLKKIPVISAVFKDNRAPITGLCTFVSYIGKTIIQCAVSIYYYVIFFFRFVFLAERYCSKSRTVAGAVILKTPGQNYVGCGFTKKNSDKLIEFKRRIEEKKEAIAQVQNPERLKILNEELADLESDLQSFIKFWANISFCAANFYKFVSKILCRPFQTHTQQASRLPFSHAQVFEIGADRASSCAIKLHETAYLVSGDAMVTVDPATGLGANTAIQTSSEFKKVLREMKSNQDLKSALQEYSYNCEKKISSIHGCSAVARRLYRPDA